MARHVKVETFHLLSLHHQQRNSELWGNLFSALCHVVLAYYARIKTAHKLVYLYIHWGVILCGSLLVEMTLVGAKRNLRFDWLCFWYTLWHSELSGPL